MSKRKCCILYNQPHENALPDELDVLDQVKYVEKSLTRLELKHTGKYHSRFYERNS